MKDVNDIIKVLEDNGIKNFNLVKNLNPLFILNSKNMVILFDQKKQTLSLSFAVNCNPDISAKLAIEFNKKFKKLTIEDVHIYKGKNNILMGKEAIVESEQRLKNEIIREKTIQMMHEHMLNDDHVGFNC